MEGCELATKGLLKMPQKASPYFLMNFIPRVRFTFHYRNPSRRNPEPLQRSWGTHLQLNRGLPNLARSFTTRSLRDTTNRLGYTMHPRGKALGNTMHPRVTSFSNFNPTYHRGELKPMHQRQKARSHKVVKSFTPKSHQSN